MKRKAISIARLRRCLPAGTAALWIYVASVTLLPFAHLFGHKADHVHGANGEIVSLSHAEAHARGLAHGHSHASQSPRRDADGKPFVDGDPADPRHGHGSAAHFAIAVLAVAIFVASAPAQRFEPLRLHPLRSTRAPRPTLFRIETRGPPALALS